VRNNRYIKTGLCALWALYVLCVTGCDLSGLVWLKAILCVAGFAALSFAVSKCEEDKTVAAIILAGIAVRTFYVLYTGCEQRQHDVGEFDTYLENNYHAEYIEYIFNNWALLDEDIRLHWQFYHPPLHHFICAVFYKIATTIVPAAKGHWDILQALPLFYSLVTMEVIRKVAGDFAKTKKSLHIALLATVLHPQLFVFSGALNNDCLAVMFTCIAIERALAWNRDRTFPKIIQVALAIGLGMGTKLSAGLVAFPVGYIFLASLIEKGDFKKRRTLIFQYIVFAIICVPLALWYQIRNYIKWGVALNYIAIPDIDLNPGLVITANAWQRFFDFDLSKDYNIIVTTLDESVFDGDYYRDNLMLALLGFFMAAAAAIVAALSFAGLIRTLIKNRNRQTLALAIFVIAELLFYVIFCFKYPYTCTQSFRYIAPILLARGPFITNLEESDSALLKTGTAASVYAFAGLSVIFYCLAWLN